MPAPDEVVIERLTAGRYEPAATREEVALAALELIRRAATRNAAALHLGVSAACVEMWVSRSAAGEPLIQGHEMGEGWAA
jgi:hypothetical protein